MRIVTVITSIFLGIVATSFIWWLFNSEPLHRSISGYVIFGKSLTTSCRTDGNCLTTAEIQHLKDVQIRIQWIYIILPILLVVSPTKSPKIGPKTLALLSITMLIISLNFQKSFEIMHYIIFPHGNWSFSKESVLIQTYPTISWWYALCAVIVLSCIFLILNLTKPYISGSMKRIYYVVTRRRS